MLSDIVEFLSDNPTATAVISVAIALSSAVAALMSAWFAGMQFRGRLVVFWRPREAGFTTLDVMVRNVGGGSVRNVEITSDEPDFRPIEFEELPSAIEYCIDTLSGESTVQEYYTRYGWKHRLRWPRRTWRIDPKKYAGVQTRGVTALRKIAETLENVERVVRDSPVLQNVGNMLGISRPGEDPWPLPSGVLAVLLPNKSETRRTHIQDETTLGSNWRQNRPSGSSAGTHVPKEVMRVVVDPEKLSRNDERKLLSYLDHGEIVLHYNRHQSPIARYWILATLDPPQGARVFKRYVAYEQPREDGTG